MTRKERSVSPRRPPKYVTTELRFLAMQSEMRALEAKIDTLRAEIARLTQLAKQ